MQYIHWYFEFLELTVQLRAGEESLYEQEDRDYEEGPHGDG